MSAPESGERRIAAGPLFLFGVCLVVLGVVRRRPLLAAGGAAAMWVDRESVLSGLSQGSGGAPPTTGPPSPSRFESHAS